MNHTNTYMELDDIHHNRSLIRETTSLPLLKRSQNIFILLCSMFIVSYGLLFAWTMIDELFATRNPEGTVQLLMNRIAVQEYDAANTLYTEPRSIEQIMEVGKKGLVLESITGVARSDEYAVVEFKAKIVADNNDIVGQFALKKINGQWLIIAEPTSAEIEKLKAI